LDGVLARRRHVFVFELWFEPENQGHLHHTPVFHCICSSLYPFSGNLELLLETQKALTLRHIPSAILPLDQLIARRHLSCRSNRPLNVLVSSGRATGNTLLKVIQFNHQGNTAAA
jgi:hypothetical protein